MEVISWKMFYKIILLAVAVAIILGNLFYFFIAFNCIIVLTFNWFSYSKDGKKLILFYPNFYFIKLKLAQPGDLIQKPYNANARSLYVKTIIVADYDVYNYFNKSLEKVHKYCKGVANVVNSVRKLPPFLFF